ncbi:CurL C-terminal domain-containing protein [Streptomyces lavendulae]|uniref:CurL C-terminal domain-containing protein n=1 Tax=Streptomyces lavendulae TaxID=1914 RepID=UPI0036E6F269
MATADTVVSAREPNPLVFVLSADSEEALARSAGRLADRLRTDDACVRSDVAHTLAVRRSTHNERWLSWPPTGRNWLSGSS